jgi:hypothetical protein
MSFQNNGGPHTGLAKYLQKKYYSDKSVEEVEKGLLNDHQRFNKGLEVYYNDNNKGKGSFDDFRNQYIKTKGDPFSVKKKRWWQRLLQRGPKFCPNCGSQL